MKNKEDIKEIRSRLNASELEDIKWLHAEISSFLKTDVVSLGGVIKLENMLSLCLLRVILGLGFLI